MKSPKTLRVVTLGIIIAGLAAVVVENAIAAAGADGYAHIEAPGLYLPR